MSAFGWFGFREVDASGRWHAFKTGHAGAPSLCRRVRLGPERSSRGRLPEAKRRPCPRCARAWAVKYPPQCNAPVFGSRCTEPPAHAGAHAVAIARLVL